MKKLFVAGVVIAAAVLSCPVRLGCRRILAGAVASIALAVWSSGVMAACVGAATGTSALGNTPQLFNLQCMTAVQIPGNPLQTFGGSAFLRMTSTTASYFLADRSNLGVDIIEMRGANSLKFSKTVKPSSADTTGGFIGQLIWTVGPATTGTARVGTPDETHSGPNGMALYPADSTAKWLWVADGGCNTMIQHATAATPTSAGTQGACGTPADPSTLPNANYGTANCINGTSTQGCYPTEHQPNIKLFNLTSDTFVHAYPTGGGPSGPNNPCVGCYPLGDYAPTGDASVKGHFGASRADAISIGTAAGTTFMLVSTPSESFIPVAAQTTSTKFGACDAAAPAAPPETPPPPFTSKTTASFPYVTLFSISAGSPPVANYIATIKVDDTSTGTLVGNGPFGCDFNGKRPPNPIAGIHWDARISRFIVALPNVLNNIPVNADGSGPGQNFVPDGPTGGPQAHEGCFYPQSTPPSANVVVAPTGYFWNCDGGLLVIDPTAVAPGTLNTIGYTGSAAGVVLKLGYCSPGAIAPGPDLALANSVPGAPPFVGAFANVLLGCSPKFNGNTAGTGSNVNIAESYSLALNVESNPFGLPGPFPTALDPVSPYNQTVAGLNPNGATPQNSRLLRPESDLPNHGAAQRGRDLRLSLAGHFVPQWGHRRPSERRQFRQGSALVCRCRRERVLRDKHHQSGDQDRGARLCRRSLERGRRICSDVFGLELPCPRRAELPHLPAGERGCHTPASGRRFHRKRCQAVRQWRHQSLRGPQRPRLRGRLPAAISQQEQMISEAVGIDLPAHFPRTCGGKATSKRYHRVKMAPQKIDKITGDYVKKLFVASVVIAAVASSAPVRAADVAPYSVAKGPIIGGFDWEGFYVGGNIGGATDNVSFNQLNVGWTSLPGGFPSSTNVSTGESGSLSATSVTGGLQMGFNWLISGPVLVGIEADISGAGLSSATSTSPPGDPSAIARWEDKLDVYGSVRARAGWVSDNWLFYGTGGFGWTYDKFTRTQTSAPLNPAVAPFVDTNALGAGTVVTHSHVRPGWVAGAGVEWALARTWTVKLEYLHFDTASETITAGHFNNLGPAGKNQASSSITFSQGDLTIDTVRVGFNHTFN